MIIALIVIAVLAAVTLLLLVVRDPDAGMRRFESSIRDEVARNREELAASLRNSNDSILGLTKINEEKLEKVRSVVESGLQSLQEDNARKLEKMRETVDEKLQSTLERRLGESFRLVSDRLESVQKGLGEMQELAAGVGDLKKVLSNVKTRGTLGEIQLGNILEQILTPDQYGKNVSTKSGSRESVEYAVKLPGREGSPLWLPIDAKFPREDYEKLLAAQEQADAELTENIGRALEARIKSEAKTIRDKYIDPPNTTDFGILFLATEGLYAEVIRRPGLFELLQKDYRIILTGPTTIAALLNSLQMGFRTLAIEKRAGEVWNLLGAVKTEFGRFGDILAKTHKQLTAATNTLEGAAKKSRTIEKKLQDVQSLPVEESARLVHDPAAEEGDENVNDGS